MGDMLSLVEEAEHKLDKDQGLRMAGKLKKGKGFDLEDFREQLQQMSEMGGMAGLLDKLPGHGQLAARSQSQVNDKEWGGWSPSSIP